MSQNTTKNNHRAKVITSPDGMEIQITAGNKWKFNRAVQRDATGRYSKLQKDLMTILIDSTNEGFGEDRSKWGFAYPSFKLLAAECGCTERAAKENIGKLEDKGVMTVRRSAGRRASGKKGNGGGGGRDKSNLYFLHGWNLFGRVENGEEETVNGDHCFEETVNAKQETVNATHGNGERRSGNGEPRSPDSSNHSSSEPTFKNTPHVAPASGERGPADDDPEGRWYEMDTNPFGDKNLKNEFSELTECWPDAFDGEACLAIYSKLRRDGVCWSQMEETFRFVIDETRSRPSLNKFLSNWGIYRDQSQSLEDEPGCADDHKPLKRKAADGYASLDEHYEMDAPF